MILLYSNEMKSKQYHTVRTVPKSNIKIVETETKSILLTHKHMTAHLPCYTTWLG